MAKEHEITDEQVVDKAAESNVGPVGEPPAEAEAQEIPRREWIDFLNRFSRQHQGWLVDIEMIDNRGKKLIQVKQRPLEGISADHVDDPDERVYVDVGKTAGDHLQHSISSPRRIRFLAPRPGAHIGLEIETADGARTTVRFRKPMLPESLDDVLAA
jgi:hypothetical protein